MCRPRGLLRCARRLPRCCTTTLSSPMSRSTTQKLDPRTWQDAERIIRETIDTPPDVVARVRELLNIAN